MSYKHNDEDDYRDDQHNDDEYNNDEYQDEYEDDFDYEEFVSENYGTSISNTQTKMIWRLVAVVLLLVFAGPVVISLLQAFSQ
ncbi:hypothetical protein Pla22_48760 [Rubripirellula amarantea]|uniref:Uncharacterized protein n=1 Tax=Rubripirellula amarantea TaxID=2527999 RepID=A0A5C5WFY9_9BACT|nr:hypothetical protein [Rubripirellula amarantea]TWT49678.1 hypothetical protein Pla22_48760 [Rubripirellula amarantea]